MGDIRDSLVRLDSFAGVPEYENPDVHLPAPQRQMPHLPDYGFVKEFAPGEPSEPKGFGRVIGAITPEPDRKPIRGGPLKKGADHGDFLKEVRSWPVPDEPEPDMELLEEEEVGEVEEIDIECGGFDMALGSGPDGIDVGGIDVEFGAPAYGMRSAGSPKVGARISPARITSLGLGMGGQITQKIYPDEYGFSVWEKRPIAKGMIHLVSSEDFMQITGRQPPETPVTYEAYQRLGIPWYRVDDKKMGDAKGSDVFGGLKPVGEGRK